MITRFLCIFFVIGINQLFACTEKEYDCSLPPIVDFSFIKDQSDFKKFTFDGNKTRDPNPGSKPSDLSYAWSLGGKGVFQNDTSLKSIMPIYTYDTIGNYEVTLTVTNIKTKKKDSKTKTINAASSSIEFVTDTFSIPEDSSPQAITIQSAKVSDQDIVLKLEFQHETANSTDYEPIPYNITIPSGHASVALQFTTVDDELEEATETLKIKIISISDPALSIGAKNQVSVSITDNDTGTPPCHGAPGAPHPNGGGFVSSSSSVDADQNLPDSVQLCDSSNISGNQSTFSGKIILSHSSVSNSEISGQVELSNALVSNATIEGNISIKTGQAVGGIDDDDDGKVSLKGNIILEDSYIHDRSTLEGNLLLRSTHVSDFAKISGRGEVISAYLSHNTKISGAGFKVEKVIMVDSSSILDQAQVRGTFNPIFMHENSVIKNQATVEGHTMIMRESSQISGQAKIKTELSLLRNRALISNDVEVQGSSSLELLNNAMLLDHVIIAPGSKIVLLENAKAQGNTKFSEINSLWGNIQVTGDSNISGSILCLSEVIQDENIYNQNRCNRPFPPPPPLPAFYKKIIQLELR